MLLRRLTREELSKLEGEAYDEYWLGCLEEISEGRKPLAVCKEAGFSVGAWMVWVRGDERRSREFDEALKAAAQVKVWEGLAIVDGEAGNEGEEAGMRKVRAGYRQWVAGRWDRGRYGENAGGGVVLNVGVMPSEEELCGRLLELAGDERFVNGLPEGLRGRLLLALGGGEVDEVPGLL